MTKINELLIWSPSIEPTVARLTVIASCDEPTDDVRLEGRLQGPTCVYAKTVEGETPLVSEPVAPGIHAGGAVQATGEVMEPCLWEPEHPFLYELRVELWQREERLARQTLPIGIRHLACDAAGLRLNGKPKALEVASIPQADLAGESSLRRWRDAGCRAAIVDGVNDDLLAGADRWGTFVLVRVANRAGTAPPSGDLDAIAAWRLHPSVAMWIVDDEASIEAVRRRDPFRPIALECQAARVPTQSAADLFAVSGSIDKIAEAASRAPKPVLAGCEGGQTLKPDTIQEVFSEQQEKLIDVPNLAGFVV